MLRERKHSEDAQAGTHLIELTSKAPEASRDCLLARALIDDLAPQLSETDDPSLEPVAAIATAAASKGPPPDVIPNQPAARPAIFAGDIAPKCSYAALPPASAASPGGGGGDFQGLQGPRCQDPEVARLAVGPLLATRVPEDSYGGVPAEQHGVDVRELVAAVTALEPRNGAAGTVSS
ncbi:hypothetical protein VOLCADRAFT_89692 [Volvox carteri f. nagariensis]|uniref:Uncharacterized protein n=1 Tax=Volvox carteri f. nagariensis TaxID=3068 RepID=D8TRU3_VOLCA|nr:uncharacterized protein VOLCADRAFT_89692 [Volvox carteri f. nagariensis]EFJ49827.1 hypothetical protein VOLCADRAFT_89692 [Volvox carteri f. nagariensis]|eukprot:XP_002949334.1 hypothetical protein VOLCADRAFT_89692 [Volvox carteri f. nagariensis]